MAEIEPKYTRGEFLRKGVNLATLLLVGATYSPGSRTSPLEVTRPKTMGVSFSQLQCSESYLNIDYKEAFKQICSIEGLAVIRLAPYINEILSPTGFKKIDWMVEHAEKEGVDLIINVGGKQFRWPESHLTPETKASLQPGQQIGSNQRSFDEVCTATEKTVTHLKDSSAVKWWQIENEPHDSFGGRTVIDELIRTQMQIVENRQRKDQNILATGSFATPESFISLRKNIALQPQAIGLNIYPERPNKDGSYSKLGEWQYANLGAQIMLLRNLDIEPWCSEAKAEPWVNTSLAPFGQKDYTDISPLKTKILCSRLTYAGINTQLLWGGEFWVKQKEAGFPEWMNEMRSYFATSPRLAA